jgi:outer membrane receptor for ferrienterochelin and colicins
MLLMPTAMLAQTTNNETLTYEKAEKAYKLGQFPLSLTYLGSITKSSSWVYQSEKHHLAALCYLALDDENAAKAQVTSLLAVNPYYSISASDPAKLVTMIESMRNGQASLVTASQMAESLDEAPVPVTLITADMIKMCGARSIKDVLLLYVPGMTDVESSNQTNIAYHGIYSTGQEKILIMLNGHRLNNRSMNSKNVDYSIDLNKVKQIEVLRGPASALYGNVALTAVVNIITFNGAETNKITANTEVGNFGQYGFGMQIGKRFNDFDLYAWVKYYNADGEKYKLSQDEVIGPKSYDGATALLGSYSQKASNDMGLTLSYKGFSLLFNRSYGKRSMPMADALVIGAPYNYGKYGKYCGSKPGTGVQNTNVDLGYEKAIGKMDISANFYYDYNVILQYMVTGDSVIALSNNYYFQDMYFDESTFGLSIKSTLQYSTGLGNGSLLLGFQGERSHIGHSYVLLGKDYTELYSYLNYPPIYSGTEKSYSGVVQIKHYFLPNVILNAGLRYDMKIRANHNHNSSLAPRLSFIYIRKLWNAKISFSRSFVDAPYYYRYNLAPSYKGSESLNPEHLSALQLTYAYHTSNNIFYTEMNLFYNHLTDFIYRNVAATGNEPRYLNAGKLNMIGLENTINFKYKSFHSDANITWQYVVKGENLSYRGSRIYNVAEVFANLLCGYKTLYHKVNTFDFNVIARFTGSQLSPYENVAYNGVAKTDENNMVPARCIFDAGINYAYKKMELSLFGYNVFNQRYKQGGSTPIPYYQMGRSVCLKLKYSF